MATYYVYFTDQCRDDATTQGFADDVEKFSKKLEQEQGTRGLERFPQPYLKKSMGRQGRLVIEEHRNGDDIVLCLARYLVRGSSEYDKFYKNTTGYYEKNKVSVEEIKKFLEKRKRSPIVPKKALSASESAYLQPTSSTLHYTEDGTYLESYDWFERISQSWAKDSLVRYYELIEFGKLQENETAVSHPKNPSVKILYRYFPERKWTFLIAPINPQNPNDEEDLREREEYKNILNPEWVDIEEIGRHSRRAYPSIIACDENTWVRVQNGNEANLALSPEEKDILASVLRSSDDGPKYPLFINGRPGSGKSTILQYLFSELLEHHIKLNETDASHNPPLYLTYSRQLLEQARSSVENILTCGAKSLQGDKKLHVDSELLNKSFRNFREFLLDQLPSEEREKFVPSKYVGFERFRKEWEGRGIRHPTLEVRVIGPELAWHAIRTFIKGMRDESGTEVDPEFYEIELARDSKSIPDAAFKLIYKNIWERWYQPFCGEEGYWDDQDLVRSVLEHSADKLSRYPAVFCDEAQDFTKIELELIERLSLYSDRALPNYLAKHVPFAFAGDPFQTLNPTGFNWSAMQAGFHDNIAQQIDGSGKLEFNFQELFFNYRSSEQIVKLANLIQLLRAVLLDIKGLRPQQCWKRKEIASPVWFRDKDASCQSKIREQEELVIIVPCQENGELEYVENDPFLAGFSLKDGQISRNILSPARAKGLEYDRVLLYRFGDKAGQRVPELPQYIREPDSDPPEIEQRLPWEYFLNQFYVAVSRARKRLFIVDSAEARQRFWMFAEPQKQSELLELYKNNKGWKREDIGGIVQGDGASWSADRDDPLTLAKEWQTQGLAQRDPYQLNLAKSNFERAGQPEKARLCEAKAYEFSEEFIKAGDSFSALGQALDACRCYWAGKDSDAVVDLVSKFPEIANNPRFLAANAIKRDRNTTEQISALLDALEKVEPLSFSDDPGESTDWRWFFEKFIPKVSQMIEASSREGWAWKPSVERIAKVLRRLSISSTAYPDLGKWYSLVGDWEAAIAHGEKCFPSRRNEPDWLILARAKKEPYPKNIPFLARLKDHKAILGAWRSDGSRISQETPVNQILTSAMQVSDVDAIRDLLPTCDDVSRILEATRVENEEVVAELNRAIPVAIVRWLETDGKWREIVNFATEQKTSHKQLNDRLSTLKILQSQAVTIAAAVRVLARSERLADEKAKSQQTISDFLKQSLIINNHSRKEQKTTMEEVHKLVSITEVGAAFERAFRLTFALEYYEQWFAKHGLSPSPEDEKFARQRWLKCKYRLSEVEGSPRGDRHKNEAQQRERDWNLSIDTEPEYPNLGPVTALNIPARQEGQSIIEHPQPETTWQDAPAPNGQTLKKESAASIISSSAQFVVDGLTLNGSMRTKKRRIVLTLADTEDEVSCGPQKVSSQDVTVKQIKDDESVKTWLIEEWKIQCEIQFCKSSSIIRFRTKEDALILGFEL